MFKTYALLIIGIFCCSTSVIFIKTSQTEVVLLSALRLLVGGLLLLPLMLRDLRRHRNAYGWGHLRRTLWPAFLLGIHFISWIQGARLTPAANATLIVNMVPIVMPFLMYFVISEVINRGEIVGTVVSLTGLVILGVADYHFSPEYALGDAVCFVSMLCYAIYLAFGRKNRDFASIYLYMVPIYLIAGVMCLAVALPLALRIPFSEQPIVTRTLPEVVSILGLGIVPTVFGHTLLNWSLKHIRGQTMAILNLGQFIFATAMAYFILNETPSQAFALTSLLLIGGAVMVIRSSPDRVSRTSKAPPEQ